MVRSIIYRLGLYNRPDVAAVPGDVSPTPPKKKQALSEFNLIFNFIVDTNTIKLIGLRVEIEKHLFHFACTNTKPVGVAVHDT
jgi:hypothetical protein